MPDKRKDTERMTFFIPKDVKKQLDEYVNANYSATDGYGAYSSVATQALSYFCSTADTKTSGPMNDDIVSVEKIQAIMDAHRETLDALADKETMK